MLEELGSIVFGPETEDRHGGGIDVLEVAGRPEDEHSLTERSHYCFEIMLPVAVRRNHVAHGRLVGELPHRQAVLSSLTVRFARLRVSTIIGVVSAITRFTARPTA